MAWVKKKNAYVMAVHGMTFWPLEIFFNMLAIPPALTFPCGLTISDLL